MSKIKEFDDILIVGLGLIGGSIAMKIKEIDYSANVYGSEKNLEILKDANKKGLDKILDLFRGVVLDQVGRAFLELSIALLKSNSEDKTTLEISSPVEGSITGSSFFEIEISSPFM